MKFLARFGPAGKPEDYKGAMEKLPFYLKEEGLNALEYQAVRGVKISQESAQQLGKNAAEADIWLTIHGPYYINLSSENKDTISASKQRLIESLKAAQWMGAHAVVFHPGYYGSYTPEEALKMCISAMKEVVEEAKNLGIAKVHLAPETTGKTTQVGGLDEIIEMCLEVENVIPAIDWAHIHAREQGSLNTINDYALVLDKLESRLGAEYVKNLHCHFSKIEFGKGGEKEHHSLDEKEYGPDFRLLAKVLVERGIEPVVISESPILDKDAIKMKAIFEEIQESSKKKSKRRSK